MRGWEASGRIGEIRPEVPTIGKAVARFIEDAEARKLSWETMRKLRRTLGQLRDWCEGNGIRELRRLNVDELRTFRASLNDSAFTQLKKIERLRSFFRFYLDAGWIEKNPAKALKPPQPEPNPTLPFTEEEMSRILKACDRYPDEYGRLGGDEAKRMKGLVLAQRYSGLRIQDAVCLPKAALEDGRIFLYSAKTSVPVRVPIPEWVETYLREMPSASIAHFFWRAAGNRRPRPATISAGGIRSSSSSRRSKTEGAIGCAIPVPWNSSLPECPLTRSLYSWGIQASGLPRNTIPRG